MVNVITSIDNEIGLKNIKIGLGSPPIRNLIVNSLRKYKNIIQYIDEKRSGSGSHIEAAIRIASRLPETNQPVDYSPKDGEIAWIQKQSRRLSKGLITIDNILKGGAIQEYKIGARTAKKYEMAELQMLKEIIRDFAHKDLEIRLDANGAFTITDQPCAVVTNATAAGGLNNSQNGVARTFQSTHISQGGMVISNTRSRITVPTSGTYLINILLSGGIATVEAGDGIIMRLRRNGANYPTADSHPVETFGSVTGMEWAFHFNLPVNLSANDYLEVCLDNIGGTVNFGVDRGYFAVNLLH